MYRTFRFTKPGLFLCAALAAMLVFPGSFFHPFALAANAPAPKGTVYLTFDDGPSENTPHLMEVLEKHQVKASFFIIGFEEADKAVLQQLASQGHTVAPHAWQHDYNSLYCSPQAFEEDFTRITSALKEIPGVNCSVYRFPGGSVNRYAPNEVLKQATELLERENITYFDWDIVSGDDTAVVYPAETLAQNVLACIDQYENPIILFHDASLCSTTADAVDLLIPQLKKQGYRFAPLDAASPKRQFYAARQ